MKIKLRDGDEKKVSIDEAVELIQAAKFVHWYDALPSGRLNKLDLMDLAFPAYLDAVPRFKTLLNPQVLDALEVASEILRKIPVDVELVDWPDDENNRDSLDKLFTATTGGYHRALPGFGPAMCTKMLHKKRPSLIPIIDSWQLQAWGKDPTAWRTSDMVDVVFCIKEAIATKADDLRVLSERLKFSEPPLPQLSAVRLHDIIFWQLSNASRGLV